MTNAPGAAEAHAAPTTMRFRPGPAPLVTRLISLIRMVDGQTDLKSKHERDEWIGMLYRVRREPGVPATIRACTTCPRLFYATATGGSRCERCTRGEH